MDGLGALAFLRANKKKLECFLAVMESTSLHKWSDTGFSIWVTIRRGCSIDSCIDCCKLKVQIHTSIRLFFWDQWRGKNLGHYWSLTAPRKKKKKHEGKCAHPCLFRDAVIFSTSHASIWHQENAPSIQVENRPWNTSFPLVQTSSPRCANKDSGGSPTDPLQRSSKRDNLNSAWTNPLRSTAGINASLQGKKECTLVTICPDMFWNVGHLPLKQWSS